MIKRIQNGKINYQKLMKNLNQIQTNPKKLLTNKPKKLSNQTKNSMFQRIRIKKIKLESNNQKWIQKMHKNEPHIKMQLGDCMEDQEEIHQMLLVDILLLIQLQEKLIIIIVDEQHLFNQKQIPGNHHYKIHQTARVNHISELINKEILQLQEINMDKKIHQLELLRKEILHQGLILIRGNHRKRELPSLLDSSSNNNKNKEIFLAQEEQEKIHPSLNELKIILAQPLQKNQPRANPSPVGQRTQQTRNSPYQKYGQQMTGAGLSGKSLQTCLLYTSDAADEEDSVELGGEGVIEKKMDGN
eukprot:TRINITY_DN12116_c0_g1_i3.p1 TRINITY_DN12116_c0_g1~~TRINITY_DN12116_c0_g1_i3.p1  ORF type:complete len:301 (-),score=21.62 TRINITY_DN12116_c0_g1_i3:8-910(-)